jgi:hypothetical protein
MFKARIIKKYGIAFFLIAFVCVNINRSINESPNPTVINASAKKCSCENEEKVNKTAVSSIANTTSNANYLVRYPFMLDCRSNYAKLNPRDITNMQDPVYDYMQPASNSTFKMRILRAVIVYFPIMKTDNFEIELRWLYRSWIHMLTFEPTKWRTDLIVFIDTNLTDHFSKPDFFLNQLKCSVFNKRTSPEQKPMCTLIHYRSVLDRNDSFINEKDPQLTEHKLFEYLATKLDIFRTSQNETGLFLSYLKANLATYNYLDSILMAFEGYDYFKSAGFDFLIRSDMDVFLTPALAVWLPRHCNDFYVGSGAYSNTFNRKRLFRISKDMNFKYVHRGNLGSTWISTPHQFRVVSYLTLLSMAYLAAEEFTEPERKSLVGTINWPEWHYGVLLLYGQNLGMNHLIGSSQLNLIALSDYIDYPSSSSKRSIFKILHIHVYHSEELFSKFMFKMNRYTNLTLSDYDASNTSEVYKYNMVNYFSFRMAMEAKHFNCSQLNQMLAQKSIAKN